MKVLSVFLISLCAFHILFSTTLMVSEARPLPLNLEKWSNWLMEIKIEPVVGKLLRPSPSRSPPSPNPNPPKGPGGVSSLSHNTASA
ncbi:hypothetical protein HN51_053219 [Arachis hypogaea]|uniref:Transmembrane protein n=1 Tax=Arachis hypogaea TaxID=3818 RepID=A0A6B9V585_ARAHY|nr:uncharacterized protein DS421_19g635870 [Arachis hypogaea]